jgi:hypothetical protein
MDNPIPSEFYDRFSEETLNNVPDPAPKASNALALPPAPRKQPAPGMDTQPAPESEVDPEDVDPIEAMVGPDGDLGKIEAEEFAELLTDSVGLLKDGLNELFKVRFEEALRKDFKDDERDMLNVVIACDQESGLSVDKLKALSEKLNLDFMKVLGIKVRYVQTKDKWQAKEYRDYQKKGIKRNAKRVAEKYLDSIWVKSQRRTLIIDPGEAAAYSAYPFIKVEDIPKFRDASDGAIKRISSVINKKELIATIFGFDFEANDIDKKRAFLNGCLILEDAASYMNSSPSSSSRQA